jgi:hypothetical protein
MFWWITIKDEASSIRWTFSQYVRKDETILKQVNLILVQDVDPTYGFVTYVDQKVASGTSLGGPLVSTTDDQAYMGVDYWNSYPKNTGRPSVRVKTQTAYNYGLFVLDLEHMPANTCGSWPAFWTSSDAAWFAEGEIDIIENINEITYSAETLHTGGDLYGCQVAGNIKGYEQTGTGTTYNCQDNATQSNYGSQYATQGCSANNNIANTYGDAFNSNKGGVYVMEWTKGSSQSGNGVISIYSFPRGSIPADITSGKPDTSLWASQGILPVFTTAGGCNTDKYFSNQKIIFDTTFCGAWAGQQQFWEQTSCYKQSKPDGSSKWPTCIDYVAANPTAYKDAYWMVNSLKVYQYQQVTASSTSSSTTDSTRYVSDCPVGTFEGATRRYILYLNR